MLVVYTEKELKILNSCCERITEEVLHLLSNCLDKRLLYHTLNHTFHEVVPAVTILAARIGIPEQEKTLLICAALLHDIGFVKQYTANESIAAEMAAELLRKCPLCESDIAQVQRLILATKMPQQPGNLLEEILCDADLSTLGRDDFFAASLNLRQELAAFGKEIPLPQWLADQLQFLQTHRYFTEAAQNLYDPVKQRNITLLQQEILHNAGCAPRLPGQDNS